VGKGHLQFSGHLPLRWILAIIALLAAASGYPAIVEVAMKLLGAK